MTKRFRFACTPWLSAVHPQLDVTARRKVVRLSARGYYNALHGHGQTQTRSAGGDVDHDDRVADGCKSSLLPALESAAARARVRQFRGSAMRQLLRGDDRPTEPATGHLFPPAAGRLLRRHRLGTRHRLARGRFVSVARFSWRWVGRSAARSLDDLAHATVDRSPNASSCVHVGTAVPERRRLGFARSCDATTVSAVSPRSTKHPSGS